MTSDTYDWRASCKKINERGRHVYQSEQWTDCSFLLGSEPNHSTIKAHRLILAMASPVFEAMFYGPMAERTDQAIAITDVEYDVFKVLLEYIYTDNITIESFDVACELAFPAHKYMLCHLKEECLAYISKNLSTNNVCRCYEFAKLLGATDLMERCTEIFSSESIDIINASSFNEAKISTITTLYEQEELVINSEIELFNALEKYVKVNNITSPVAQQVIVDETPPPQADIKPSASNDKPLVVETPLPESPDSSPTIRDAMKKIRFLTIPAREFALGPSKSNLLSQSEILAILLNISSAECGVPMPEGFSTSRISRLGLNAGFGLQGIRNRNLYNYGNTCESCGTYMATNRYCHSCTYGDDSDSSS